MSPTMKNALKSAATLAAIALLVALLLVLANAFMKPPPPPPPKLELEDVAVLNAIAPTGTDDRTALDEAYFVLTGPVEAADIAEWNEKNGDSGSQNIGVVKYKILLSAYKSVKGPHAGMVFVKTRTEGYSNNLLEIMTAIKPDGTFFVMRLLNVRQEHKLPGEDNYAAGDIDKINAALLGKNVSVVTVNDIKGGLTVTIGAGATRTSGIFINAIELSAKIFAEVTENG